jgi:hypothetical protein
MQPRTRNRIRALAGLVTLSALSLLIGVTPEEGANANVATPSVASASVRHLDATVRPHTISGSGYDLVGSDGGVFVFPTGNPLVGGFFGSLPQLHIAVRNIVGITPTNSYSGYDLVGSDGGVFVFPVGQPRGFYGSLPGLGINVNNIVGIVPTNNSTGYDLVGSDGGVFVFPVGQSSGFVGSIPQQNVHVNNIVGISATPDDKGYWLLSTDGTVYPFGDAQNFGDNYGPCAGELGRYFCPQKLAGARFVGIAPTPDGGGYWLVTATGQVLNFGDAPLLGQLSGGSVNNIVSIVPTSDGKGYWMVASDGGIFAFGDAAFIGSLPGLGISVNNVVGAVPTVWLQS